jgi:serine/threonine protein kinase/tetratricopeptide (TPR) repeat protein
MARPDQSGCPSTAELELLLEEPGRQGPLGEHVNACAHCRQAVKEIEANNELMARLARVTPTPQGDRESGAARPPTGPTPLIEGYEIHDEIHRGGQGVVYRATQQTTSRVVALKVLLAGALATSRQRRRFEREIELAATLDHPNIVTVFDSGQTREGWHYFAMQYVEGMPLDEYVRAALQTRGADGRQRARKVLELFAKICAALAYAHQRGVIHRDLKPSNIRIDARGEPHILDFGLARALAVDAEQSRLTLPDTFLGTLAYASPEQVRGSPELLDTRTDVYSLGVILYEMLTGHPPYPVDGPVTEVLRNIAETQPERPSSWHRRSNPDATPAASTTLPCKVDAELETVVLKALAKEPGRRYQSADELRWDIQHYLRGEPVSARRPSAAYQLRKFARRNKVLVGGVAAVLGALILGVIGTGVGMARAVAARNTAETEQVRAQAEAEKARAVSQFLERMLAAVRPEQARGREVTVKEVLDAAAEQVEQGSLADKPEVEATIRNTIGRSYAALGDYAAAEPQFLRALESRRRLQGPEHPSVATALNNLAAVYHLRGRYADAEPLLAAALEIRRRVLGEDHLDTLASVNNLALLYYHQGRYAEAEPLYQTALEIGRRMLGAAHPDTLNPMNNLVLLYEQQGRYAEAEALALQVVEVRRDKLGEDHPDTLASLSNLAMVYAAQGRQEEATNLDLEVLAGRRRVLGPEHPDTLASMNNLALMYARTERYAEAEKLYAEALEIRRRVQGEEHPGTLLLMENLAGLYEQHGRYDQAEPLYAKVAEAHARVLGDDHPYTLATLYNLGNCLIKAGKFTEAESEARHCYERHVAVFGPDDPKTTAAVELLIELYETWGQPHQAAEWRAKLPSLPATQPAAQSTPNSN